MTESTFHQQLAELQAKIDVLPEAYRCRLNQLVAHAKQRFAAINKNKTKARTALDDWRLAMKYLIFDREARVRESQV
jgi:hypothetical protein